MRLRASAGETMRVGKLGILILMVSVPVALPPPAQAVEEIFPFLPGVSIGVPIGALPPPGSYLSGFVNYFDFDVRDKDGRKTGIKVQDVNLGAQLLWVPDITILGASYGAFVVQPFRKATVVTPAGEVSGFDPINTVISPVNLSWNLRNGFFISAGLTVYPETYSYNRFRPENVGRNYITIEPSFGISYFKDGWNLSLHPLIDFNFVNRANRYKSGTVFLMDFTATKQFGKWEFGLGGTVVEQLSDDTIRGVPVQPGPAGNSRGNRGRQLILGPLVGYDFGELSLKFYYQRNVYTENTAGGNRFWFKIDVPLTSKSIPAKAADAAGTRS